MKYIRTNEGIYQIKDEKIYQDILKNMFYEATNHEHIYLEAIIKESDKLDKLCDHLVVIEKGSSMLPFLQHRFLGDLFLADSWDRRFQENKIEVYGAIWTKGKDEEPILKSVAKLNEEGELELL